MNLVETRASGFVFLHLAASAVVADGLTRTALVPLGTFVKGGRTYTITRRDVREIVANFRSGAMGEIPGDYEHASESPEIAEGGPVPASSWVKDLDDDVDANGILWGSVKFTPRATQMINDEEYKYVSPFLVWGARDKEGKRIGTVLSSFALTNHPFFDQMPAITLAATSITAAAEPAKGASNMPHKVTLNAAKNGLMVQHKPEDQPEDFCKFDDIEGFSGAFSPHTKQEEGAGEGMIAASTVTLADIPRDTKTGLYAFDRIPAGKKLVGTDVFAAQRRQSDALAAFNLAVTQGKIAGDEDRRNDFLAMACSDLPRFQRIVAGMQEVPLGVSGHSRGGDNSMSGELTRLDDEIEKLAASKVSAGTEYSVALQQVFNERPDLRKKRAQFMS